MKLKLCIAALLLLYAYGRLQGQTAGKTSLINSTAINSKLKMLNYKSPATRLSNFKDTYLILDFFSIYCGSCITELPRLDSLQKMYKGRLQFIVVSREPMADVKNFLALNKRAKNISLPFVVEDTLLRTIFPFSIIPHEVWLDNGFYVKAVTDQYEVSENNINKFLNGDELHLPVKQDELAFTTEMPLFEQGNGGSPNSLVCRSIFSRYLPGVPSASGQPLTGSLQRFYYINLPLYSLYAAAYGMPANRIISNLPDTIDNLTQHTAWLAQWLYSYEITVPKNYPTLKRTLWMQQDLHRYTGYRAGIENRKVGCWFLTKTKSIQADMPSVAPADAMINVQKGDSTARLVLHINDALSDSNIPLIVFDSVKEKLDRNILFSPQEKTIVAVQQVLNTYGYSLVYHEVTIPMLVISNNPD